MTTSIGPPPTTFTKVGAVATTNTAPKLATGPNPFEQAAGQSGGPNPFEQAASRNAGSAPANPFELARSGVRTGPENPFEANARQEAEERARQEQLAEIERQKKEREEARQEAIAQREEAERQRKFAAELAASQHNYEDDAADRAYRRASNQQNQERGARAAQSQNNNFFLELQQQIGRMYGNNSASSVYADPSTVAGNSSGKGGNASGASGTSGSVKPRPGADGAWHTTAVNSQTGQSYVYQDIWTICPFCGGTGCSNCKGTGWIMNMSQSKWVSQQLSERTRFVASWENPLRRPKPAEDRCPAITDDKFSMTNSQWKGPRS